MKRHLRHRGSLAVIIAVGIAAVFCRMFVIDAAVVSGRSMLPLLKPGEPVLVAKAAYGLRAFGRYFIRWALPAPGEIVAAANPVTGEPVVKRVASISAGDRIFLLGDNPGESTDSRSYGSVPVESVIGRVILLPIWLSP